MKKLALSGLAVLGLLAWTVAVATSQPPDDRKDDRPPRKDKGRDDRKDKGRDDRKDRGPDRKGPPKGFQLGKLLPPHIADEIELTEEQHKQLAELEKETRKKLQKILTDKQQKQIEKLGQRGPGPKDGPPRDKGKRPPPPDDDDRPGKEKGKRRPPPRDDD